MPYADSGDIRIYYESHGEGPALLFLHGGNGNTLSWFHQIPYFAPRWRCIAVDLRTFKSSHCPADKYHPRYFVDDLLAVLDHAGVSRTAIVSQSMGAWAGLPLAMRHPARVSALVISSSPTTVWSPENEAVLKKSIDTALAVQRGELPKARAMGMSERFMREQPGLTFLYEAIGRANGPRRTATQSDESLRILPRDLEGYAVPTLVTGGAHDNFLTPTAHLHVASLIPGAKSHTFLHSGHSGYFEEPDEYNRVVAGFLDACGANR